MITVNNKSLLCFCYFQYSVDILILEHRNRCRFSMCVYVCVCDYHSRPSTPAPIFVLSRDYLPDRIINNDVIV